MYACGVVAVALEELRQPPLADPAGGELRPQVAENVDRLAGVGLEQPEQRRVLLAARRRASRGMRMPSW